MMKPSRFSRRDFVKTALGMAAAARFPYASTSRAASDLPIHIGFIGCGSRSIDAYKKVMDLKDVNYVILATPPHFRPAHLRAAVEATYSGQIIEWDNALNSTQDLTPSTYEFGPIPARPVPMPGKYMFS